MDPSAPRFAAKLTWFLVAGGAAAGCASSPTYLPDAATFVQPDVMACLAQSPDAPERGYPCCQALAFFADGEMTKVSGQEGFPGNYELDGHVASGKIFGHSFAFDLTTNVASGATLIEGQWIPDVDNVASIACGP